MPTFFTVTQLFGVIAAATRKYVAEEMSPGTITFFAYSSSAGFTYTLFPSVRISTPNSSNISSVWFRLTSGSVTDVSPSA